MYRSFFQRWILPSLLILLVSPFSSMLFAQSSLPDLSVGAEDVNVLDDDIVEGEQVQIVAVIHNLGNVPADSVVVLMYDNADGFAEVLVIFEEAVVDIPANSSVRVRGVWDTEGQAGSNGIGIEVDPRSQIDESNEDNNFVLIDVDVLPKEEFPDVDLEAVSLRVIPNNPEDSVVEGDIVRIEAVVRNNGDISANAPIRITDNADGLLPVIVVIFEEEVELPAGEQLTITAEWNTAGQLGVNQISLDVDPDNVVPESVESNNSVVTEIEVLPFSQTITFHGTLSLELFADSRECWSITSDDGKVFEPFAGPLDELLRPENNGRTLMVTGRVPDILPAIPSCSGGAFFEVINFEFDPPPPNLPDLAITDLRFQSIGGDNVIREGDRVSIEVRILNNSDVPVDNAIIRVFDNQDGDLTVTVLIFEASISLQPGDEASVSGSWDTTHQAGPNLVSAIVDPDNEIKEWNEINNKLSANVFVSPGRELSVAVLSGDRQMGLVGAELPEQLIVKVTDPFGHPVEGITVGFVVIEGGGILPNFFAPLKTDQNGVVGTPFTLGPEPGRNVVEASIQSIHHTAASVRFTELAVRAIQPGILKIVEDLVEIKMSGSDTGGTARFRLTNLGNQSIDVVEVRTTNLINPAVRCGSVSGCGITADLISFFPQQIRGFLPADTAYVEVSVTLPPQLSVSDHPVLRGTFLGEITANGFDTTSQIGFVDIARLSVEVSGSPTRLDIIQDQISIDVPAPGGSGAGRFEVVNTGATPLGPVVFSISDLSSPNIRCGNARCVIPPDFISIIPRQIDFMPPGQTSSVRIEVAFPENLPAGVYSGIITAEGFGPSSDMIEVDRAELKINVGETGKNLSIIEDRIDINISPNDSIGFGTIHVTNLGNQPIGLVELRASDLYHLFLDCTDGCTIPSENVIISPSEIANLRPSETIPIELTVHVPDNVARGPYAGEITATEISSNGTALALDQVELRVNLLEENVSVAISPDPIEIRIIPNDSVGAGTFRVTNLGNQAFRLVRLQATELINPMLRCPVVRGCAILPEDILIAPNEIENFQASKEIPIDLTILLPVRLPEGPYIGKVNVLEVTSPMGPIILLAEAELRVDILGGTGRLKIIPHQINIQITGQAESEGAAFFEVANLGTTTFSPVVFTASDLNNVEVDCVNLPECTIASQFVSIMPPEIGLLNPGQRESVRLEVSVPDIAVDGLYVGKLEAAGFTPTGNAGETAAAELRVNVRRESPGGLSISIFGGNDQNGVIGRPLPEMLTVQVMNRFGIPMQGIAVRFVTFDGGHFPGGPPIFPPIETTIKITDGSGVASTEFVLGYNPGVQRVEASVGMLEISNVEFTEFAFSREDGRAEAFSILSGNNQVGLPGTELAEPLVVRASNFAGMPVPGMEVIFVVRDGEGHVSNTIVRTRMGGRARTFLTLGRSPGINTVEARVFNLTPVKFTAFAGGDTRIEGDVNEDRIVDLHDVIDLINVVLGLNPPTPAADVNEDGIIDILDLLRVVEIILEMEPDAETVMSMPELRSKLFSLVGEDLTNEFFDKQNIELKSFESFSLDQNVPNPFNPSTTIEYTIPSSEENGVSVKLVILDMRGRLVRTLVDEEQNAGNHSVVWDGANDFGETVGSGIYFYQFQTGGGFRAVKKMVLLK